MLIYAIKNLAQSKTDYVCDSQETIDAAPAYIKPTCTIGGEADANTVLVNNQQAWLTQKAGLFTVDLQTAVEGGVVWTVIDLNSEPENTDRQYFVLDPTTGLYNEAVGLNAAKTLLSQTQKTYLSFSNINDYTIMTSWT